MRGRIALSSAAGWTLALLAAFLLVNALWCCVARAAGWGYPFDTFLGDPTDRFADFLKVALSYPDARPIASGDLLGLRAHVVAHMLADYDPRSPLFTSHATSGITHFHLTPFTTLLALVAGKGMRMMEPAIVLLAASVALAGYAVQVCHLAGRTTRERAIWFAAMMLSYPLLLVWDRGNLFAGLAALALIHALLLAMRGGSLGMMALLFAVAFNIRPNAAPFLLLAMMWDWRRAVPLVAATMVATAAMGLVSLAAANALYPAYTLASFLAGLERYYWLYVVRDGGLAAGSSLLGACKLLFGNRIGLDRMTAIAGLSIIAATLVVHRRLDRPTSAFLVAAGTALGSAVYADYHLLVFFVVPMAWAVERRPVRLGMPATIGGIALCLSWLVLVPKDYLFVGTVSLQVVGNPILLLAGSVTMLAVALQGTKTQKGGPLPDRPIGREGPSPALPG